MRYTRHKEKKCLTKTAGRVGLENSSLAAHQSAQGQTSHTANTFYVHTRDGRAGHEKARWDDELSTGHPIASLLGSRDKGRAGLLYITPSAHIPTQPANPCVCTGHPRPSLRVTAPCTCLRSARHNQGLGPGSFSAVVEAPNLAELELTGCGGRARWQDGRRRRNPLHGSELMGSIA